jgi:hypothetical protein
VDQVRTSRTNRQAAEKLLLGLEEAADESKRNQLLLQALTLQSRAIAALEQGLMAVAET